jgi:hypothetical protein
VLKAKKILTAVLALSLIGSMFIAAPSVASAASVNIALNKTATASSVNGANTANLAFDGNTGTRWESTQGVDPQWIEVDLGSNYSVTGAQLNWETAAAKAYSIQVSTDNTNWTTVYSETTGVGGIENPTFNAATARYVRMYGTVRTTQYGYSLWEFQVYGTAVANTTNVALNKTATASSVTGTNTASLAFDGNTSTRWESLYTDPQWIEVDLGSNYSVTGAQLNWETAAAKAYSIQVSTDNTNWTTVYSETTGVGGIENPTFNAATARYVRMYGTVRTTGYGYSLWEFQVYGTPIGGGTTVATPAITPATGTYTSAQSVTISDGTSGATIRYTTDGSTPSETNGTVYGGAFNVAATTTVKAIAYQSGSTDSAITTSVITIGSTGNISAPTGLAVTGVTTSSVSLSWAAVSGATSYNVYRAFAANGTYTKANTAAVTSTTYTDANLDTCTFYYEVTAVNASGESVKSGSVSGTTTFTLGPNVYVFDPTMNPTDVQTTCTNIFTQQESNQFGDQRYDLLFKPGTYNLTDVRVGFYTQVAGLGNNPDDVNINGGVSVDAGWNAGNATCNFWRSCDNLAITPSTGQTGWAVSQDAPLRRVHIKGNLSLFDGGWSSGGYMSDTKTDGTVIPGSQQQWYSMNDTWGTWSGGVWNIIFVGDNNAPTAGTFSTSNPITVVNQSPTEKEAPFMTIDGNGNYSMFVPSLQKNTQGITWANGNEAGTSIPMSQFYIAQPATANVANINAALAQGKDLIFTPGIYNLSSAINITNPNTVVYGLGFATLRPTNGNACMTVADVDGVSISGLIFDAAGSTTSPYLLQIGPKGSSTADHTANPTNLTDICFRAGGAVAGSCNECLEINSNNVMSSNIWAWRADHGNGVGWTTNTANNGVVVNGNNVTMYGLAVEHFQQYQTLWNGNGGAIYFYQSEEPYDVPTQASWMDGSVNGYSSIKISNNVTSFQGYGIGVYSFFDVGPQIFLDSAIECPVNANVKFNDCVTVFLTGNGGINHVINSTGGQAANGTGNQIVVSFP